MNGELLCLAYRFTAALVQRICDCDEIQNDSLNTPDKVTISGRLKNR